MTRVISVVSGKGGVGKTTMTSNLGVALSKHGEDVVIIDGNFSGANIAQHFGMGFQDVSLNDVLEGDAYITQAVAKHPEGVSVLPASILEFESETENLKHSLIDFLGDKDYVLIDAAAGVGDEVEAAVEASDEVLLVSKPELPSLTNTLGATELADHNDRDVIGLVLNEVSDENHEVEHEDIKELVGEDFIGRVPDHEHVREAIALRNPVVSYKPESRASHAIEDVAYKMRGEEPPERGLGTKIRYKMDEIDLI